MTFCTPIADISGNRLPGSCIVKCALLILMFQHMHTTTTITTAYRRDVNLDVFLFQQDLECFSLNSHSVFLKGTHPPAHKKLKGGVMFVYVYVCM